MFDTDASRISLGGKVAAGGARKVLEGAAIGKTTIKTSTAEQLTTVYRSVPGAKATGTDSSGMVITIDGPAGTGKSTVSQVVAQRLGFDFLDTGAMYRAIGLEALRRNANLEDQRELAFIARHVKIEFDWHKTPPGVLLNGEPVGHLLRGAEATRAASYIAVVPAIRELMVAQQRKIGGERKNIVTEGRDQGSVVFPDAECKFYLDATPIERARRRSAQLRARGEIVDYQDILNQIVARDQRDASRKVGPLAIPVNAIVIDTTHMSEGQVVDAIVSQVKAGAR